MNHLITSMMAFCEADYEAANGSAYEGAYERATLFGRQFEGSNSAFLKPPVTIGNVMTALHS